MPNESEKRDIEILPSDYQPTQAEKNEWEDMDKTIDLLLGMKAVKHERPKKPRKEDLARRFFLRKDKKGDPKIIEVK